MKKKNQGFATRAIHQSRGYTERTGAVMPPVFLTSTFESGNPEGFDYTRSGNPNFRLLERTLASLEGGAFATSFASGVSAITAVVSSLKAGDLVIAEEVLYGCTYRLFEQIFRKFGVNIQYFDLSKVRNWKRIEERKPALVWIESPTNPVLKVLDIRGISRAARKAGATIVVDNTFASPYAQTPLDLGATLSLHSTTKFINGHSDCLGGVVITNSKRWHDKMIFAQKALGLQPSPFDAWLTARGARTMALRMKQHSQNALGLARWLEQQKGIRRVIYPLLESHPQFELAKKQMKLGSGLIAVELESNATGALAFLKRLKLFTLAESLGGVESLACHPWSMTHASMPLNVKKKIGLRDSMVRLSVGIEDFEDLQADLGSALRGLASK